MTYLGTKFEVATSNGLGGDAFTRKYIILRCIYKKIHYLTFDLDIGAKVSQNVAHYPLHYATHLGTKLKVAMSKGLGGETFTRNVTDGHTDRQTDDGHTLARN